MRRKKVLASILEKMLIELGIDLSKGDLQKTPQRVAKTLLELTRGYVEEVPAVKLFDAPKDDQVIVIGDLHFFSKCEHHMETFEGKVTFAYVPDKKIIGLSKPARAVDHFSHKLMIQERFEQELLDWFWKNVKPKGVIIKIQARHLCSASRGVRSWEHYVKNFTWKFQPRFEGSMLEWRIWKAIEWR